MIVALQTLLFFRETLITVIERFLGQYYRRLSLKFKGDEEDDDEESDDHVFAEYDDEKGVVFYPPVYAQRYAAVSDCLMDERWSGKLEKVVDLGYHDMSFIKYLKDVPGIRHILGVDLESIPLRCSSDLLGCDNYTTKRETPLQVTLFQGNAADPDYRLIGCDAVVAIEMIEHMLPHDLERLIHTVFGFIKPRVAIFTTPNGDFNVLFKALEKNGLRRLDHMFEWSREQFHDWCSNIVARYPEYTVTCKGIGPGPPDTLHLGCCSQLAMFVAEDYTKQPDLNLNSLALVAKTSSPNDLSHIVGSWESPDSTIENMLCAPPSVESYPELMYEEPSCMTFALDSPSSSLDALEYRDKTVQCNLDSEIGKSFLMFDDEVFYNVLVPRREKYYRVYEIEDVASRLNCSTFLVKKFSKATQSLMAKNQMDSFAHTREIVNEIRHLMKMLNFNKQCTNRDFDGTWCNINWGVNAPYWNQYYKIVREYSYPFEAKTEETRILDLITEEINRLIDTEYDEDIGSDMQKLEIPINQLMQVVEHITTDVDTVKELLEWNGYEVVDGLVIHSRLIVDNVSEGSQEDDWQEDTISDWDTTEVRSTSVSDGSTIVPDYYGLRLRRAIDQKVRKLRTLLTADKDITTELDRVVCRLMKLALCTSKGRQNPPPISWMQCKLFDLLTLTEKSVERRRLQGYSLKAIEYHKDIISHDELMKKDSTGDRIVSKYENLNLPSDRDYKIYINGDLQLHDDYESDYYNNYNNIASNEFKGGVLEYKNKTIQEEHNNDSMLKDLKEVNDTHNIELFIEETSQLDQCNVELVPCPSCKSISGLNSSEGSTCSTSNDAGKNLENSRDNTRASLYKKYKINGLGTIKMQSKTFQKKRSNSTFEIKHKASRTKINKKVSYRRSSYINVLKYDSFECQKYKLKERKKQIKQQIYQSTPSRPIPGSLIELCNTQSNKNMEKNGSTVSNSNRNEIRQLNSDIAATEKLMFIGIVTEDGEETIAMRRNIGISSEFDFDLLENEDVLETVTNLSKDNSYCGLKIETGNVQSQTLFLYDLNEPSTSKGIRHFSTDVQCGPDAIIACPILSQTTSFTKMPKLFTTGIKIEEPSTDIIKNKITCDFGTSTEIGNTYVMLGRKSVGIKIKESIHDITESFTMTQLIEDKSIPTSTELTNFDSRNETKLIKPVSSALKIEDSGSELCGSLGSYAKSPTRLGTSSKNNSDFQIQSVSNEENVIVKQLQLTCDRTNLVCGGIHVHSFKERQVSEDVMYQGEWQRNRHLPKRNYRKNLPLPKRQKLNLKDTSRLNEIKKIPKTIVSVTNHKSTIKSQETLNKTVQNKKKYLKNTVKTTKHNIVNIKKVPSKVTVSSHISQNMKTIYTTKKRSSVNTIENTVKKEKDSKKINKIKNYLPLYLRRKIQSSTIKNNSVQNNNENEVNKSETILKEPLFPTGYTREITKDLIKIPEKTLLTDINYMIFRNEIQAENNSNTPLPLNTGMIINNSLDRSHSPSSQHSSTCSSPNSVATVRAVSTRNRITCNRRNSTSSERSSSGILESENKTAKNKKFVRRSKSIKKPQMLPNIQCDNKENVPESSKKSIDPNSNTGKSAKSVFLGRTKSVFMAQITSETSTIPMSSTAISKSKMQTLNKSIKLPLINAGNTDDEIFEPSPISATLEASLDENLKNNDSNYYSSTNVPDDDSLKYETYIEPSSNNSFDYDTCSTPNKVDDESLNNGPSIHNTKSCLISAIRKLIENKLNIPENSYDRSDSDSETVILSRDENYVNRCNDQFSPTCIDTVIKNDIILKNCGSGSDMDYSHIHCPSTVEENNIVTSYADLKPPDTESDAISLKSFASMSTSKLSEYYLADNEFESTVPQIDTLNTNSIQDIFERKEGNTIPNVGGVLAIQAFSGFSVNEPITGDQPDFVNFIDSETGSFAFESTRQAASEEIFVSGRSSDTYESCYVDEDAYVPNWLFNMISRQQSAEESEAEEINLPLQMPMIEPDFDINGNAMEPEIGVGAGAGDGRGIHSDHSQDSSGRGTSLSSSETSSGLQSEAISIDPSSFTAQLDYLREPLNIAAINGAPNRMETSAVSNAGENIEVDTSNHQSRNPRILINPVQIASDVDADVSSLETDGVDSDN